MKKIIFAIIGTISLTVGMLTTVTPFPTIPFMLAAAFCFTHSTEKINSFFCGTIVYRKFLQPVIDRLQPENADRHDNV